MLGLKNQSEKQQVIPPGTWRNIYYVTGLRELKSTGKPFGGGRVWYQKPGTHVPIPAEVIAADDSQAVTIMCPESEQWLRVPAEHLCRRE